MKRLSQQGNPFLFLLAFLHTSPLPCHITLPTIPFPSPNLLLSLFSPRLNLPSSPLLPPPTTLFLISPFPPPENFSVPNLQFKTRKTYLARAKWQKNKQKKRVTHPKNFYSIPISWLVQKTKKQKQNKQQTKRTSRSQCVWIIDSVL